MARVLTEMALRFLRAPCVVSRPTTSRDGAGGQSKTLEQIEATVGRLEEITSSADVPDVIAEKLGARQPYRFSLPPTSQVRPGDRLVIDGRAFDVLTRSKPTDAVLVRGLCVEVG